MYNSFASMDPLSMLLSFEYWAMDQPSTAHSAEVSPFIFITHHVGPRVTLNSVFI